MDKKTKSKCINKDSVAFFVGALLLAALTFGLIKTVIVFGDAEQELNNVHSVSVLDPSTGRYNEGDDFGSAKTGLIVAALITVLLVIVSGFGTVCCFVGGIDRW